jgi:AhpC/TSA family
VIWGRSSWAVRTVAQDVIQTSSATKSNPRYKILWKATLPNVLWLAFACDLPGETPMKINDKAPDFTLPDENGKEVALTDLRTKTVVLYFYPRADTPG